MSARFESVLESISAAEALGRMEAIGSIALPVRSDSNRWRGLLLKRDVSGLRAATVGELVRPELWLSPDERLEVALERMVQAELGRMPVVRDDVLVGSISRPDIKSYFDLESRLGFPLSELTCDLSPDDLMFEGNLTEYLMIGASALECIRRALEATRTPVDRILDFGCGHGRVLRMLKLAFSEAELTACDLDPEAAAFCAGKFGAEAAVSRRELTQVEIRGPFDLIWSGSVLTHLPEHSWLEAWLFESLLTPAGTAVFSTHGPWGAEQLGSGALDYGLSRSEIAAMLEGFKQSGFGYVDYAGQRGYGIAVCAPQWVSRAIDAQVGLELVAHEPVAWAGHQDVVVVSRVP